MSLRTKQWYTIGGIAVMVIAILALFYSNRLYFRSPVVLLPDPQNVVATDKDLQVSRSNGGDMFTNLKEVSGGNATNAMSYESAYRLYQGRMVQLDQNCRSQPLTLLIPQKSVIMIGNDSPWQRSVIVGPRTYAIGPYDYVLSAFNTPGNFAITCDSVQSVAIISVQ